MLTFKVILLAAKWYEEKHFTSIRLGVYLVHAQWYAHML